MSYATRVPLVFPAWLDVKVFTTDVNVVPRDRDAVVPVNVWAVLNPETGLVLEGGSASCDSEARRAANEAVRELVRIEEAAAAFEAEMAAGFAYEAT